MLDSKNAVLSEATRLARFMDLPRWKKMDDLGLVDCVRAGFPVRTVSVVVKKIDPDSRFVKESDIIPRSTLHRRKDQALTKDESEKVLALSKVFSEILCVYHGDARKAAAFLVQEHPMLHDRCPLDLAIESIVGADLVMKLVAKADAGVAA